MKKNGFTLAEVLITLSIIGVVATMTLPALMTNTQEQQAKTGLKKGINTLTEAAQMHEALEGRNFATIPDENDLKSLVQNDAGGEDGKTTVNSVKSFVGMMRDRTKVDVKKTEAAAKEGAKKVETLATLSKTDVIYLLDGSAIIFDAEDVKSTTANSTYDDDNLPVGVTIVLDTNGDKGPNVLSHCATSITLTGADDKDTDVTTCNDKKQRMIGDQFQLKLRGSHVEPLGAAATWAFGG